MRTLLLLPIMACTLAKAELPKFVDSITGDIIQVNDTTVKLKTKVYVSNWVQATDTLRYDFYRNDTLMVTRRSVNTIDSAFVFAPIVGRTSIYRGCAQVERGGRDSGVKSGLACWSWTFTRQVPAPAIDSVKQIVLRTVPADGRAEIGTNIRVCAFGITVSGRKVKLKNSWNVPECQTAYVVWLNEETALR